MSVEFLQEIFREHSNNEALVWKDQSYSYEWLLNRLHYWVDELAARQLPAGSVVALEADFSPESVALFLALAQHQCVLVPLTGSVKAQQLEFLEVSQSEQKITLDQHDEARFEMLGGAATHEYYATLRRRHHPGLVLFSSGSTGKSKAAVHDLVKILQKFKVRRNSFRTLTFLLYDHIGGVNTMLYTLSNGGCIVTVGERSPDAVLHAVERHRVQLLPTSPTFINLILLSEAYKRYNLESLQLVTYGTEPMPESTLKRFHELFPDISLLQTYGLSEVGILRSKSKSSDSLWVKIGGEGFQTRVVDNILHIKSESAMLGYLNAQSPFTEDGWFVTGDSVEVDGEFMRILGRESEIINVGGEKVYPAEVESTIQELDNVREAVVHGEPNPITGRIVVASVSLKEPEDRAAFVKRLKKHCRTRLQPYKVPVKVSLVNVSQHSDRFKKMRPVKGGR